MKDLKLDVSQFDSGIRPLEPDLSIRPPQRREFRRRTSRINEPDAICGTSQFIGKRLLGRRNNHHHSPASHRLDDWYEIRICGNQKRYLEKSVEGTFKHINCDEAINSLLAAWPASNSAKANLRIRQEFNGAPVFFNERMSTIIRSGVIVEDAVEANSDVGVPHKRTRLRSSWMPPVLDETRVRNVGSQCPWINERSARTLSYLTQVSSINKTVRVHEGQVYNRMCSITRDLHRADTRFARSRR